MPALLKLMRDVGAAGAWGCFLWREGEGVQRRIASLP